MYEAHANRDGQSDENRRDVIGTMEGKEIAQLDRKVLGIRAEFDYPNLGNIVTVRKVRHVPAVKRSIERRAYSPTTVITMNNPPKKNQGLPRKEPCALGRLIVRLIVRVIGVVTRSHPTPPHCRDQFGTN